MDISVRKDFYVYFHRDTSGKIFYVGKGTKRRAASRDRHPAWTKYVTERLHGQYTVEIHADGLTEEDAQDLEWSLICEYGEQLVNWLNPGRALDFQALDRYHALRDKNRIFVSETKQYEATNLQLAVDRYSQALRAMREYESMTLERGLVAQLDVGPNWGDPNILDRLTLCLSKLGHLGEAIAVANSYFTDFPAALNLAVGQRIHKRVAKIKSKLSESL